MFFYVFIFRVSVIYFFRALQPQPTRKKSKIARKQKKIENCEYVDYNDIKLSNFFSILQLSGKPINFFSKLFFYCLMKAFKN